VPVILFATGLFFGLLLLLNNLIKAFSHGKKARFADALLAFLTTLLLIAALIANIISETPDPYLDQAVRWVAIVLFAISLMIFIAALFQSRRLRGKEALLAIFCSILIVIATFAVPFLSAYIELRNEGELVVMENTPTLTTSDPEATEEARVESTVERLFKAIQEIVANEIEVNVEEVFRLLDEGVPLAHLIEDNGGDLSYVVDRLTVILSAGLREAASRGEVGSLQAALLLSQMDTLVRFAVNNDLNQIVDVLNGGPTPTGTRQSFLSMLTPSPNATQPSNTLAPVQSPANTPDPRQSATPTTG